MTDEQMAAHYKAEWKILLERNMALEVQIKSLEERIRREAMSND